MPIFVKIRNFGQTSKFWSNIEILVKIEILGKNRNFKNRSVNSRNFTHNFQNKKNKLKNIFRLLAKNFSETFFVAQTEKEGCFSVSNWFSSKVDLFTGKCEKCSLFINIFLVNFS